MPKLFSIAICITMFLAVACEKPKNSNNDDHTLKADFNYTINQNTVSLTNTSQNADSLSWHFDDGVLSDEQNPQHVYTTKGTHKVILEVFQRCKDQNDPDHKKIFCTSSSVSKSFTIDIIPTPTTGDLALDYMEISEKKDSAVVYLYGNFAGVSYGDALPADAVVINNHPSNRVWYASSNLIKCTIGGQDALNGHGAMYVQVGNKKSNTRTITMWKTHIIYNKQDLNTLYQKAVFQIALRADIGAHKDLPYLGNIASSCTSASFVDIAMGGEGECPDGSTRIALTAATGTLSWSEPGKDHYDDNKFPENFQFECIYKDHHFVVSGMRAHKKAATQMFTYHPGTDPYKNAFNFDIEALGINDTFNIDIDNAGNISGIKIVQPPHSPEYDFECWSNSNPAPTFSNSIDVYTAKPM